MAGPSGGGPGVERIASIVTGALDPAQRDGGDLSHNFFPISNI
jgi:hypothetical protein